MFVIFIFIFIILSDLRLSVVRSRFWHTTRSCLYGVISICLWCLLFKPFISGLKIHLKFLVTTSALDYQLLFGEGARAPTRHETAAEIESTTVKKYFLTTLLFLLEVSAVGQRITYLAKLYHKPRKILRFRLIFKSCEHI